MRAPMRRSRWLILAFVLVVISSGCAGVAYQPASLNTVAPATVAATPMANPTAQASPALAQPSPTIAAETGATTADVGPAAEATVVSAAAAGPVASEAGAATAVVSPTAEAAPAPTGGSRPPASQIAADTETSNSTNMAGADTSAAAATAAEPAATGQGVLYQDDFTDTGSGWPDNLEFGNYNIGYHEPNHYHVDVHTPHDRALVAAPQRGFSDFTVEVQVQAEPNNTAKAGDFRYGLFFRRSGNEYYAFAVSPRTGTWYALKSSPTGLTELAKGSNGSIQGLTAPDALRVDVQGSTFFFHINNQIIGQVSDADYASGEVGFYVETFDSPRVHAHYGTITVRKAEAPHLQCTVATPALRLRLGPGTDYPIITYLSDGARLVPVARSPNGLWVEVRLSGSNQTGWIASSPELVACSMPVDSLPLPSQ
jgi:hypothetical protein